MQQLQADAIPFCLQSWMIANVKFKSQMGRTREAPTPSPKTLSILGAKNEPKTSSLYLLVLVITIFFFRVDERGPVFPKPAIEALRGSARPGYAKIQQDLITTTSRAPNVARGRLNSASSV